MKLQKKLTMLGVALATTGMLAVSNMSSVSAKEEIFDATEIYNAVNKDNKKYLILEYAFLYKNQTNPDAYIEYKDKVVTVQEKLKSEPLSKYENLFKFSKEMLEQVRLKGVEKIDKLTQRKGVWQQTEKGWVYAWMSRSGKVGIVAEGWIQDGGNWYYLGTNGVMVTGWAQVDGKWYYLKSSGAMATGWVQDNGNWYYLDASGALKTGWFEVGGKWYYAYASGALAVSTTIDGYTVNANGEWI